MHVRRAGNRALAGGGAARENALAGAGGPLSPQQRAHSHAAGLRLSLSLRPLSVSLGPLSPQQRAHSHAAGLRLSLSQEKKNYHIKQKKLLIYVASRMRTVCMYCMYIRRYICMYVCMYVNIVFIYVCMHVYI